MQPFPVQQSFGHRRQRVCAALVGLGLLTGLGGCGSNADSASAEAAQTPTAQASPSETTTTETGATTELDGTYSLTWSVEELTEALSEVFGGAENPEAQQAAEEIGSGNAGTIRLVLDAGRYDLVYVDQNNDSCPGTYVVDGDRIVMTATSNPAEWNCGDGLGETAVKARWSVDEDTLTFIEWDLPDGPSMMHFYAGFFGGKPFERVES